MKQMFLEMKEYVKENPREVFYGVSFMIGWLCLTYFLLWFGSIFCYDM